MCKQKLQGENGENQGAPDSKPAVFKTGAFIHLLFSIPFFILIGVYPYLFIFFRILKGINCAFIRIHMNGNHTPQVNRFL